MIRVTQQQQLASGARARSSSTRFVSARPIAPAVKRANSGSSRAERRLSLTIAASSDDGFDQDALWETGLKAAHMVELEDNSTLWHFDVDATTLPSSKALADAQAREEELQKEVSNLKDALAAESAAMKQIATQCQESEQGNEAFEAALASEKVAAEKLAAEVRAVQQTVEDMQKALTEATAEHTAKEAKIKDLEERLAAEIEAHKSNSADDSRVIEDALKLWRNAEAVRLEENAAKEAKIKDLEERLAAEIEAHKSSSEDEARVVEDALKLWRNAEAVRLEERKASSVRASALGAKIVALQEQLQEARAAAEGKQKAEKPEAKEAASVSAE